MPTSPHSAKRCHSEPVRTLAWESVSPRLPLRGRCQREALTEGEMPRVFLSPSRLRRQPPPRGGLTARRCRADGTSYPKGICSAALHCRTPSPTRGSTYRPVGRGPRAPPKNAYPAAGHMGPALQVHTPPKKQRGAPCGAPRVFRPCVAQTEEGYIRRFYKREPRGTPPKGRKDANLLGNDIPRVFYFPVT